MISKARWKVRARFDRKIADFLICDRVTLQVLAIVELKRQKMGEAMCTPVQMEAVLPGPVSHRSSSRAIRRLGQSPMMAHDINATILRLLGMDHLKRTYVFQGRDMRLTDVHGENEFTKRLLG